VRPGSYGEWIRRYDTITSADRAALRAEAARMPQRPLISILLPVYNAQLDWLGEAINSVKAQTYPQWELCIADDASTKSHVRPFLKEQAQSDPRIKLVFRPTNGHISACSNSALAQATGAWCGLLDQDDVLAEHALSLVAREIDARPGAGLIYSDEDFIDVSGTRSNPFIKPDWNPELFLGQNYVNHFGVYRTELLREIGGFREGFEGSQDYDLVLRSVEQLHRGQIRHIPRVLYHWRMVPGSLAEVRDAKPYAKDAARRALSEHVARTGTRATVEPCPESIESHRMRYEVPSPPPSVTLMLYVSHVYEHPSTSAGVIRERTGYPNCEIVDVERSEGLTLAASLNDAAMRSGAELLVFLDAALEITEADWLDELVSQAMRPDVGAVGARVWNADDTLRHGGYLLGVGGIASSAHEGLPRGHAGFFNRTFLQRNCSAVSLECMAVRAEVFRELGGFDAANLRDTFHDVDFCLRAGERGLHVVWTPYVNPIAQASAAPSGSSPVDEEYMRSRWGTKLPNDPFYSPSLSLELPAFELAFPPRWLSDWSTSPPPEAAAARQPDRAPPAPRGTPQSFADRLRRWWRGARTG
jgi:O-antigen biosynthesis protein